MSRFQDIPDDDANQPGIDISPLIDCVFIMLIFFIVTTTFIEEPGAEVTKTQMHTREKLEREAIYFAVTVEGDVMYADRSVGVSGVQAVVRRMLEKDNVPVIVQADQGAEHGVFMRVVKEAKLGGAEQVNIATEIRTN